MLEPELALTKTTNGEEKYEYSEKHSFKNKTNKANAVLPVPGV